MFLVLVVHSDFVSLGYPTLEQLQANPVEVTGKNYVESIAIICVNLFVLISGYFGIRTRFENVFKFLFQCFFFAVLIYVVFVCMGQAKTDVFTMVNETVFYWLRKNWFVACYLGLMFIAPVVNPLFEHRDYKAIKYAMVLFSIVVFVQCFFLGVKGAWTDYSICHLVYMYCLGRTLRLYRDKGVGILNKRPVVYILWYVVFTIVNTIYADVQLRWQLPWSAYSYQFPLVVLGSVLFFLAFANLRLNKDYAFVNRIAKSSFAVYLIHTNPYVYPYFSGTIQDIYNNSSFLVNGGGKILMFLVLIFVCSVLLDQIQIIANTYILDRIKRTRLFSRLIH